MAVPHLHISLLDVLNMALLSFILQKQRFILSIKLKIFCSIGQDAFCVNSFYLAFLLDAKGRAARLTAGPQSSDLSYHWIMNLIASSIHESFFVE